MRQSIQAKLSGQVRFAKVATWVSSKGVSRVERVIKADSGAAALAATPAKPNLTSAFCCRRWGCLYVNIMLARYESLWERSCSPKPRLARGITNLTSKLEERECGFGST